MFENIEPTNSYPILSKQEQIKIYPPLTLTNNTNFKPLQQLGNYQFSFQRKLGSGLTSDAYIGINKLTKQQVCIKIIDKQTFKKQEQKILMENQIKCQKSINSEYIIKIIDVLDTNSFCFIITQLCLHGDLYRLINHTRNGIDQQNVIKLSKDIVYALKVLKEKQIIHRDIKSQNILLNNGRAKLGDFGFAIQLKNLNKKQKNNIGSPLYMSLQVLKQNKYSYQSDIFSFGIVLYQMIHKQSPWQCNDQKQLIKKMQTQKIIFKNNISQNLKQLICGCLQHNPQKRLTIQQIIQHKIYKQ